MPANAPYLSSASLGKPSIGGAAGFGSQGQGTICTMGRFWGAGGWTAQSRLQRWADGRRWHSSLLMGAFGAVAWFLLN